MKNFRYIVSTQTTTNHKDGTQTVTFTPCDKPFKNPYLSLAASKQACEMVNELTGSTTEYHIVISEVKS